MPNAWNMDASAPAPVGSTPSVSARNVGSQVETP